MRSWLVGMAPRRRAVVVSALVLALLCLTGFTAVSARGDGAAADPSTFASRSDLRPPAVILVPGYGGGRSALNGLATFLRERHRFAIVFRLPGGGTGDLNLQAKALQSLAARVTARSGGPVDVVGYSAGGVVVRLWVANYGGAAEARHVITLGAPFHGANLAGVAEALAPGACPVACQQLVPGSVLLTQLASIPIPSTVDWMSIWTTDDRTVDPPDSARLPGAVNVVVQDICPHREVISHRDLPTDPLVVLLVLSALSSGSIPTPDSSDCPWISMT